MKDITDQNNYTRSGKLWFNVGWFIFAPIAFFLMFTEAERVEVKQTILQALDALEEKQAEELRC
jgi:hypothetical protein